VGILILVGSAFTLVDFLEGSMQTEHTTPKLIAARTGGNMYRSFAGFVGGPSHAERCAATKSLLFGFRFFLMMTLSAYTANLASILTAEKAFLGVSSVDDVVRLRMKVCVYITAIPEVIAYDTRLESLLVPVALFGEPRHILQGKCDAFISYENSIPEMLAGHLNQYDCAALDRGDLTADEAQCKRNGDGTPALDRDCGYRKVGDLIGTIPFSWPLNPNLPEKVQHALAWSVLDRRHFVETRVKQFANEVPASECGAGTASNDKDHGLAIENLIGATLLMAIFVAIGTGIALYGCSVRKPEKVCPSSEISSSEAESLRMCAKILLDQAQRQEAVG